jgi:hypothetical protein
VDRDGALARLNLMLGGDARPVLSPEAVASLLDSYAAKDRYGLTPVDEGWTPTYALNAAAAEGWRLKGSMVAGDYSFSADDASYSKGDVLANCLAMEARYAAMDSGTVQFSDTDPTAYPVENLFVN